MKLRYLVVFFAVIFLTACTTPFKSIPTSDSDFQQPPEELVKNFEDVKRFHPEFKRNNYVQGKYQQLVDNWGKPDEIIADKEHGYAQLGMFSAFTGTFLIEYPLAWIGAIGLIAWIQPDPPEWHIWNKEKYQIKAHTRVAPEIYKDRVVDYWDWKVKNSDNYVSLFNKNQLRLHPLLQIRMAKGFDTFGDTDIENPAGGSGWDFELGLELKNVFSNIDAVLLYGDKKTTIIDHDDKNKKGTITNNPIELLALYQLDDRWRIGGGLSYLTNTSIDYNYKNDESLEDTLGLSVQLDFKSFVKQRVGIAIKYLEQDRPNGGSFSSSNFSAFANTAFW